MKQETQMFCGDSAVELLKIKDNSVDMLCSDPPYGYSFMNKGWDQVLPDTEIWRQSYRVLKPGAFITVMAAPRTDVLWRISRDLEEAGFDLSFTNIEWVYHSGFPKATDISKSLDKRKGRIGYDLSNIKNQLKDLYKQSGKTFAKIDEECGFKATGYLRITSRDDDGWGEALPTEEKWRKISEVIGATEEIYETYKSYFEEAEREIIGQKTSGIGKAFTEDGWGSGSDEVDITIASTDVAKKYEGSKAGFQPKPAREIIIVGMKPFNDGSYVDKVLNFEALPDNIKMTYPLIQTPKPAKKEKNINVEKYLVWENEELTQELTELNEHLKDISVDMMSQVEEQEWNIISFGNNITEQSLKDYKFIISIISKMIIELKTLNSSPLSITKDYTLDVIRMINKNGLNLVDYVGNISQLKLNTTNEKLEYLLGAVSVVLPTLLRIKEKGRIGNIHSTVKPIKLMSYLITLFTRPGDWILDPFGGSGTTGLACKLLDRNHIYIDFTEEYYDIAQERLQVSKEDLKKLLKEKISNGQQELF